MSEHRVRIDPQQRTAPQLRKLARALILLATRVGEPPAPSSTAAGAGSGSGSAGAGSGSGGGS